MNSVNNVNSANVANANEDTPIYNLIFNNLIYYYKIIINHKIKWINDMWIKDCNATHHIHHNKSIFSDYHSLKNHFYIEEIDNDLMTMRIDNISIINPVNNNRILKKILHIPKLKNDLMSLNQLTLKKWISIIMKDDCIIIHNKFKIHNLIRNKLCVWS